MTSDELTADLAYLTRLVHRVTRDATLRDELFSAGQARLLHADTVARHAANLTAYRRCAMHSAVLDELTRQQRYSRRYLLTDACAIFDHPDAMTSPSPETLLLLRESAHAA